MRRRILFTAGGVVLAGLLVVGGSFAWTEFAASGHEHEVADSPAADVVMVLGTEVVAGQPSPRLAGRLDTAAELVRAGKAKVVLVSGDGNGQSGNETAAMTAYLSGHGVDPERVVSDPYGLDTYDSCIRARDVFGVTKLLVVTQAYHLSRAVALCRHVGLAADGVPAGCPDCAPGVLREKAVRDFLASTKAAWDAVSNRDPEVRSPADPAVSEAVKR